MKREENQDLHTNPRSIYIKQFATGFAAASANLPKPLTIPHEFKSTSFMVSHEDVYVKAYIA